MKTTLALLALAASHVSALAMPDFSHEGSVAARSAYPFNQIVAFGDELSDNGNGSYAHGITGNPANVYGAGTWTNGPVAVSYLADLLGVPLRDLAFGGCCGGGTYGAVLNNSYTSGAAQVAGAPVPAFYDQIHSNYTALAHPNIHNALEFIWIGENDVSEHTDAFWPGDARNAAFAANFSGRVTAEAEFLVAQGAPYVFVANIYPKHLAPVTAKYLCPDGSCVAGFGQVISQANAALKASLAASPLAAHFIYYDVFTFMVDLMDDKDAHGLTQPLTAFCDGDGTAEWDACIAGSYVWQGAQQFFWMSFIQPTTAVHKLIAQDMKNTIDAFLGV